MHLPVLLKEVLELLDPHPGDFMVDGTVDGGGHAAEILKKILPDGRLLGLDWDSEMIADTQKKFAIHNSQSVNNALFLKGNYADLPEILQCERLPKADGLLLDLGFSSEQLASSGRGFSFSEASKDEPLLMTYDDGREPLRDVLRRISEKELADVIFQFGGERRSRGIAKAIVEHRRRRQIVTVGDLANVVRAALPKGYEHGRIDPATRTFQALRIYANDELGNLQKILGELSEILAPGGRAAIITFHSLEDRIVKLAFREMAKSGRFELLTKKPIAATREEIRENPRSRSAKLRGIILKQLEG
jgi:16S rRNA (cytosine1402-N4)-methyltransferase